MAYDEQKNGGLAAIGFSQSRLLKGSLASSLASAQALGRRCRSIPFSFENELHRARMRMRSLARFRCDGDCARSCSSEVFNAKNCENASRASAGA